MYKILVIGERCTDVFVYGKAERLSPEGPAPVFIPTHTTHNDGMAHNVLNNLLSFNCDVYSHFNRNNKPIIKTRYVDYSSNHLFLRVDENDRCEQINLDELPTLSEFDMVIISDYDKGFLTTEDIYYISSHHPTTLIDTKKELGEWAKNLKFIKLNRNELNRNMKYITENQWLDDKLIITLDKDGAMYKNNIYPSDYTEVLDVSGAGDTFVAGFSYMYLKMNDIIESILFANKCSSQVIRKKGVTVVDYNF